MDLIDSQPEMVHDKALLIGIQHRGQGEWEVKDSIRELEQLASTAGAVDLKPLIYKQFDIHPGYFIGRGKAEEIAAIAEESGSTLVIFDEELSPAQGRNLERLIKVRVVDRTQLILDIFAQHARTREGCLQIELAQLEYLLPRLRRMWTHLERQKGGIGLRGPGEQQLEMDRRKIQQKIHRLKKDLAGVQRHRKELRRGRRRHGWALISVVGYTNAGKSTLLNAMTGAEVKTEDQLFATLDPTTRQMRLSNNQQVLTTDTVGFIKKLPLHLVESFKATLEEVVEADVLLHVIDASHPNVDEQIESVQQILKDLGAGEKPTIFALNKMDCPESAQHWRRISERCRPFVKISAKDRTGLDALREQVAAVLSDHQTSVKLKIPVQDGATIAMVKDVGDIHLEDYEAETFVEIHATIPKRYVRKFESFSTEPIPEEKKGW